MVKISRTFHEALIAGCIGMLAIACGNGDGDQTYDWEQVGGQVSPAGAESEDPTMLVIGTSAVVQPAASLALQAKAEGARVVEINLEATPHSQHLDLVLQGKAGVLLPQLVEGW